MGFQSTDKLEGAPGRRIVQIWVVEELELGGAQGLGRASRAREVTVETAR